MELCVCRQARSQQRAHCDISACASAEEDLRGAAGGREHSGGAAVCQEVAHVLALGAAVVVALACAGVLVFGAHVQRVAACGVDVDSGKCRLRNMQLAMLKISAYCCWLILAITNASRWQHVEVVYVG